MIELVCDGMIKLVDDGLYGECTIIQYVMINGIFTINSCPRLRAIQCLMMNYPALAMNDWQDLISNQVYVPRIYPTNVLSRNDNMQLSCQDLLEKLIVASKHPC